MVDAGVGLTDVDTAALKRALKHLHAGELECPVSIVGLTRIGLQYRAGELMRELRDLDEVGVRAVLVCVLAERAQAR